MNKEFLVILLAFPKCKETPRNQKMPATFRTGEMQILRDQEASAAQEMSVMGPRGESGSGEEQHAPVAVAPPGHGGDPLRDQFRRMSGYFNILDRVFHPKRQYAQLSTTTASSAPHSTRGVHQSSSSSSTVGQPQDGVFSNMSAKPESAADRRERLRRVELLAGLDTGYEEYLAKYHQSRSADGSEPPAAHTAQRTLDTGGYDDEVERQDKPPTYEEASFDAVPSYWDLSPESALYYDEICVDGLPAGNLINFLWNCIISACFKFFGFLITYILHTSHAAKEGSRCGLGITFLLFAYSIIPNNVSHKVGKGKEMLKVQLANPDQHSGLFLTLGIDDNNKLDRDIPTTTLTPATATTTTTTTTGSVTPSSSSSSTNLDTFHSRLSHGYEETNGDKNKYMNILAILIFIVGTIMIFNSFYNYFRIKRLEKNIMRQQETIQELQESQQHQNHRALAPSPSSSSSPHLNPPTLLPATNTTTNTTINTTTNTTDPRRFSTTSSLPLSQSSLPFDDLSNIDHSAIQSD